MSWLIENSLIAAVMALVVWLICRYGKPSPALAHVLWVLVLVKLVCPPVLHWSVPISEPAALAALNPPANPTANPASPLHAGEVASRLEIPIGTVKSRMFLAVQRLRKGLGHGS